MFCQLADYLFFRKAHFVSLLFLFSILVSRDSDAQCSVTSYRGGSVFSNNTSVGSLSWSSMGNVSLSDNGRASNGTLVGALATQNTNYIAVQGFGFSIPSTASICGVEITIERRATGLLIGSSVKDNSIRLIKNNVISGTNLASTGNWPGSDGNHIYGGANETWGSAWTPGDINAANFGVVISARLSAGLASLFLTAEIDQVSVRVFFNVVLPVQLFNFKAIQQEENVYLEWATVSENNNHHFIVERSADGTSEWNTIDSVAGAGNSNRFLNYHASDKTPLPVGFYRLRQTDNNGHETYSNIVGVWFNETRAGLRVYPNPVRDELTILFPFKADRILIKNTVGKTIGVKNYVTQPGGAKIKLPELPKGYYWLIIQSSQNIYTKKILVW